MDSKKIIAICQSGGEFMTNKDGSLSYSGGDAYALDIDSETRLEDFKSELSDMFNCSADAITLKYFLPGNKKILITISKDKDLHRMLNFLGDCPTADLFVITDEAAVRYVSNLPASRSSRTTVSEAMVPVAEALDVAVDASSPDGQDELGHFSAPLRSVPPGSTDENNCKASQQWENTITGVDQRFGNFGEFREALHKYSIAHGFAYVYKKNDSHRVTVKCKTQTCPWRIYASKLSTTQLVCIKRMHNDHTCDGAAVKAGYRATKGWVGSIIKEKLKVAPNYKPKDIAEDIKREYGIQLNYSQARRAKRVVREQLQCSFKEAYAHLPAFCAKIKETNPGSIATFTTKEDSSFHRLFVAFHALLVGFQQGCRPLLFLDSTALNSKYEGVLFAATSADGDDNIFPVAFAVADAETDENWRWFLTELKSALPTAQQITFVSDFQYGLKESLSEVFDKSYHSHCLRRLAEKLNKDLRGQFSHEARRFMIDDFYAAAYAPKLEGFQRCLEGMKSISPDAYDWVVRSGPEHWANAFFNGARYNHMNSNFGEEFYKWVSEAHELPITQMIDALRGRMMQSMYMRRADSNRWTTRLTPSNEEKLEKEILSAQSLHVVILPNGTFEVRGECLEVVDVDNWDCSCKQWQLSGLPCCHAIAAIESTGRNPYDYCSRYMMADIYRLTYSESIQPVPDVDQPASSDENEALVIVTPPPARRTHWRPKMQKTESIDVLKRQLQCSNCKGLGHNKKTCKAVGGPLFGGALTDN